MTKHAPRRRQLNEFAIRKAKPERRAYLIWDTRQRGLVLSVQPTGSRAWKVIYARAGRTRWLTLGDVDSIGLADARMLAGEVMLEVARGRDPAADRRAERNSGTFAELAARYVDDHAQKHNKSWKHADTLVRRFLIPAWGKLAARDIGRADVKAMMRRGEATPAQANLVLANASAIFSWAVREEIIAANPCRGVSRNPVRSRDRVLSDSEVPQFWLAFGAAGPAGAVLKMILLSGQRPGECAHMRREHLVDGWWQMPGEPVAKLGWPGTKSGRSHRVWLSKGAQDLVDGNTGFVFGARVQGIDRTMQRICVRIGCERATPHDLRRTFGSTVTRLKFGRLAMDRILNHADRSIGSVYDRHAYTEEDQRIMEAVAKHIIDLAEGRPADNVLTFPHR